MLTTEERNEIIDAYMHDNDCSIHDMCRAIERAVMTKAGEQEHFEVMEFRPGGAKFLSGIERLDAGAKLYAHPLPAQAIPEGFQLAPMEPTASMLDAGVAMALQVSVQGEGGWSKYLSGLYKQMLSASPKP